MIRDITIGQYYQRESPIHRLDPRTKIIMTIVYIVAVFLVKSFAGFGFVTLCLAAVIAVSRVPLSFILRGLKPIFLIILFTFFLNIFMYGGTVLLKIGPLTITDEGLRTAVFMAIRLILLIIGSSMLTLTTRPIQLTDGIESLLSPLKRVGVPSHELAMMMTIALRFIPTLLEETDKIMKAQQARGADFESGSIFRRAKNMIPILVPLFVSAFRIAQDMALAMEARCYHGGEGRTRMNKIKFGAGDAVMGLLMIGFIAVVVLERVYL
ncbi:MAG: energy-coupling factor transporter transmembrane protein EcfT [Firmicutes bacterium]|nr:energy-coupling factor transporter transmembrane protein EcfT [Bacillota bacterium]